MIARYSPPDLAALWSEAGRLGAYLEVEAAV